MLVGADAIAGGKLEHGWWPILRSNDGCRRGHGGGRVLAILLTDIAQHEDCQASELGLLELAAYIT